MYVHSYTYAYRAGRLKYIYKKASSYSETERERERSRKIKQNKKHILCFTCGKLGNLYCSDDCKNLIHIVFYCVTKCPYTVCSQMGVKCKQEPFKDTEDKDY